MFNFSVLPFCQSDTIYSNGEVFHISINIVPKIDYRLEINKLIQFTLQIDKSKSIIL